MNGLPPPPDRRPGWFQRSLMRPGSSVGQMAAARKGGLPRVMRLTFSLKEKVAAEQPD